MILLLKHLILQMKDVDFQNLVEKLTNDEALAVFPDFDSASLGKLVYIRNYTFV